MMISDLRTIYLNGLAEFMDHVILQPGIRKISLIGSICSFKPEPKDIDILIHLDDLTDLSSLAKRTRQFCGRMQSYGHGAEVFLVDRQHTFLGRICHWKDCRPGVRQACDALNCGAIKYLHDDLKTVTLNKDLITHPPVELWPAVVIRAEIPVDLQKMIIDPLIKKYALTKNKIDQTVHFS